MSDDAELLGHGLYWQDMTVGRRFKTFGRTITDADISAFCGVVGYTEVLFTNAEYRREHSAMPGRVAPGAQVFAVAEGLTIGSTIQATGIAFLSCNVDIKGPVQAGDTLHVVIEVVEARAASKGNRGLVRTRNEVVNQNGEVVMVYDPLRLMRGNPEAEAA